MAVTRIKNNQITDATIFANVKIAPGTIVGSLFAPSVTINSDIAIVGNLNVSGNTSTIQSTNTLVNDPLIIFNNGYSGTPMYDIGMLASRNLQPTAPTNYGGLNAAWIWREADNAWEGLLTTETGITQGTINRSAYANLSIGNTVIRTGGANSSVVEAVDTATGALQVKGGASFTQNIQVGGTGSLFGANTGAVPIQSNLPVVQITQLSSTRPGLMITDTVNNGALTLRTGIFGASIQSYGGTNNDIYLQPNNQPSLILQAGNGAVIATAGINSTNANVGSIVIAGSGGLGVGGNLNVGTAAMFEGQHITLQSAKQNDIAIGKNILKTGLGANVVAIGTMLGTTALAQNTTAVGAAGPVNSGVNTTTFGFKAGNISTGQNNQFFGYNSGSLVTTGAFNSIFGSHDGNTIATLSNYTIIADGAGNPRINIDNTGNVWIVSGNDSTSPTTGALTVKGGVGISGNLNVFGPAAFAAGQVKLDATSTSLLLAGNTASQYITGTGVTIVGQGIGVAGPAVFGTGTTAVGYQAFNTASTANQVTLFGYRSGYAGPGVNTTAVGALSGSGLTSTAQNNQFFGYNSGSAVITGNYNVILGANTGSTINTLNNRIIIADGQGTARVNIDNTGQTEITSTVQTTSIGTGALIVDGGLSVQLDTRIGGNLVVTGNLNVFGAVSTINSTFMTVDDPIIELGIGANASALTSDDGKDRGLRMHYYQNADRSAFLGYQSATGNLVYYTAATESSGNVFSGTYGSVQFGQLKLSNAVASTSQITGTMVVAGGIGLQGRLTANNAVVDNNLTASGQDAIITFSPVGAGYVTIAPATSGTMDNMTIGSATPKPATITNLIATGFATMNGSGTVSLQPALNVVINPGLAGTMDNMYIGNITPRQARFTAVKVNQDLVLNAFTSNAVLFMSQSGNLSVDQQVASFNYQRLTGNTFSGVAHAIGHSSQEDLLAQGTDTLNIKYQGDSWLPQSLISANVISSVPGWTVSTARGTATAPTVTQDGDFNGVFGAYSWTGATPAYAEIGAWRYLNQGTTSATAGIGGQAQLWTKQDNGASTLALRVDANQTATFYGQVVVANTTTTTNSTTGALYVYGGVSSGGNIVVAQGARFNDSQLSNRDFIVRGGNDATLIWANTASGYNQVLIGNSAIGSTLVTGAKLQINSTDSIMLPKGTEAQRPGVTGYGAAVAGMIRFNTIAGDLEYFDGSKWYQPQAGVPNLLTAYNKVGDGTTTQFTIGNATTAGTFIAINGTLQEPVTAYSITGNVITFTEPPAIGDSISIRTITSTIIRGVASGYGTVAVVVDDRGTLVTNPYGGITTGVQANAVAFTNDFATGWRGTSEVAVGTTPTLVYSFDKTIYRSGKFVLQVQNSTYGFYEASEVLVVHDGSYAYRTQFGVVSTWANAASVGSVTVAISSGNVNIYYTGKTTSNTVKVKADLLSIAQPFSPW